MTSSRIAASVGAIALACSLFAADACAQNANRGLRATHALARGDTLKAADIIADSGATIDASRMVGWVARRVISQGELLRAPAVGPAAAMKAGTAVTVRIVAGGVSISRFGVALFDAGLGDSVRVRIDARTSITGRVQDKNTVVVSN